ncbi:hypothetical protein RJ639_011552 [Escallonia herrerae]|uniref:Uncharacterized protein n=1 Tax=Escallonia herrerae TaxID=1293975 RepID=A0AA89AQE5_9ASTE|nr:hypothetical protein RJ639_011552 [Escallonia herrerae]
MNMLSNEYVALRVGNCEQAHHFPLSHLFLRVGAKVFCFVHEVKSRLQEVKSIIIRRPPLPFPPWQYDSILPWALDIAHELGLYGASFFTQSCAVSAIYYHTSRASLDIGSLEGENVVLPSMPLMGVKDLPSFISDMDAYPALLRLVLDRFSNFEKADWLLFNSFDKLECEVVNWMASQWPIKTIGPTIPSIREEIEMCIREVMEGERGKELKRNAVRWKEFAKEAVGEGGCSDKHIDEFISELVCR